MALNREQVSRIVKKEKRDRWDIYNNLLYGDIAYIAGQTGCPHNHVWRVLHGVSPDEHGIIKQAELQAAINIWKTRFCKTESEL